MKFIFVLISLVFVNSAHSKISYELVKDGLDIVWGMDFISPESIVLTERSGKMKRLNLNTKKIDEVSGVPSVYARGQGGLLDVKLHPNFKDNNILYFTYSKKKGGNGTTVLAMANLVGNKLVDLKILLEGKGSSDTRRHYGSKITFDENNNVYFGIGDRGDRDNPQDLSNHFGKILRLTDKGEVPKDNPFVNKKNALPEIWSYGHRNPQGLYYDIPSKTLYEMEHGPRGGDEINVVKKGKNYGWPIISYGKEYWGPVAVGEGTERKGMEQPLIYYVPSIAPCGLTLYRGDKYPELKDKLLAGALKLTHINVVNLKGEETMRLFDDKDMRVRSVTVSPDQFIYFSTDGGKIYKVVNN